MPNAHRYLTTKAFKGGNFTKSSPQARLNIQWAKFSGEIFQQQVGTIFKHYFLSLITEAQIC